MNDLLDLDFDPAKAPVKPPSLLPSRIASPFLQASSANGGQANYHLSASSSASSFPVPSRTTTPLARPSSAAPKQDAFSSLFASASTNGSDAQALSLVERQRKMDEERAERERRERDAFNFEGWGHAGAVNAGALKAGPAAPSKPVTLAASNPVIRPSSASGKPSSSWDFDYLLAPPTLAVPPRGKSTSPVPAKQPADPWDMAIFDSALPTRDKANDFGTSRHDVDGDEDVLGLLSKPVVELENVAERPKVSFA